MNKQMEVSDYVPDGLHPMQYSLHILQEILGWPAKGNCELMADCLTAIGKAKNITDKQAYKYMVRAITLAKDQGITVDRMFFMNGEYVNVRPSRPIPSGTCDAECRSRHGRGYHENDIKWLWRRCNALKAEGKAVNEAAIWGLLDELDSKREGGAPKWRTKGVGA